MSEPDWEKFRISNTFDPPGEKQRKLFAFMDAFIDWRANTVLSKVVSEMVETNKNEKQKKKKRARR